MLDTLYILIKPSQNPILLHQDEETEEVRGLIAVQGCQLNGNGTQAVWSMINQAINSSYPGGQDYGD